MRVEAEQFDLPLGLPAIPLAPKLTLEAEAFKAELLGRLDIEGASLLLRLIERDAAVSAALVKATKRFRDYEALHRIKGTLEGEEKACANAALAAECEAALMTHCEEAALFESRNPVPKL